MYAILLHRGIKKAETGSHADEINQSKSNCANSIISAGLST